ncbi:MAG: hypothetical protein NZM35_01725 [Chitinophagales bacterium]|nr:hypothetical protein [Chitinophagales bacterium]MDW8419304.1 hypothetical protein [Chitinophagales bacterium]
MFKGLFLQIIIWFGIIARNTLSAQDVAVLDDYEKAIKQGTVITYEVTEGNNTYQWIVKLIKVGSEISYTWETTEPSLQKGNVTLTANALQKAELLQCLFTSGNVTAEKTGTIFLSRKMFDEITNTSQLKLRVKGPEDAETVMGNTIVNISFTINDIPAAIQGWELEDSERKYNIIVVESMKFPLVYSCDMGIKLRLISIQTP